jgi:hypothetical protein
MCHPASSVLLCLILSGFAFAQGPSLTVAPPAPVLPAETAGLSAVSSAEGPHVWLSADYLLWFLKPNNIRTPLILSTRDPKEDLGSSFSAGGLADPNAYVVFGGGNRDRGPYSGVQATLGVDLSGDGTLGAELGGLWLPRQGNHFRIQSNASGVPAITLPFNNVNPAAGPLGETAGIFAGLFNGAIMQGRAEVFTATQLWGGEANLTANLYRSESLRLDGLGGFRYLGMNDLLTVAAAVTAGGSGAIYDRFYTENHFYGAQVGARATWCLGSFQAVLTAKAALGDSHDILSISGNAGLPAFAMTGAPQLPGGFYTAASNIGRSSKDSFAVVSETNLSLGYRVTDWLSLSAGYSFLYWSQVMRTGDQITRNINPNFNPAFSSFGTPLSGPAEPSRLERETSFWAHGVNFGVTFSW